MRALREDDLDAYLDAFAADDELLNLLGHDDEPAAGSVQRWFEANWVDPPELRHWEFAIAEGESDRFLGTIMIHSCDWKNRRGEIGAWTVPDTRDRGIGSAAFQLVLDWAFGELALERIEITALPENVSVPHLAEKFGFTFEGTLRKRNLERGRRVDLLLWSLLAEERNGAAG